MSSSRTVPSERAQPPGHHDPARPARSALTTARVLQIGKYFPPDLGGIERVTEDLVEYLRVEAGEVHVVCFTTPTTERLDERTDGIFRFRPEMTVRSAPISVGLLLWIAARRDRYDLIHVHMPNPWAMLVMPFIGRSTRVVLHWHSDIVKQRLLKYLVRPWTRLGLRRCSAVLVTSPVYAAASEDLAPYPSKVRIVPLGIEDDADRVIDDADLAFVRALTHGRRLVFALGRLVYYKGFDVLVDAATRLPDDTCVVIGGSGPLEGALKEDVADRGLGSRVLLTGSLTAGQVRALMASCDVFVLPSISRVEAFGLVQLEAMAFSRCVISTRIEGSGVSWVNEDGVTGVVVKPADPEALAAAIRTVLGDPELAARLGRAGRLRFEERFTKARMLAATRAVYEEILGTGTSGSV